MNRSLRTAATGMAAQQINVDVIAHNLANVNTTGFKKSRAEFQDLMYQTLKANGEGNHPNVRPSAEIEIGTGTLPVATLKSFDQGDIQPTNNPLDVAIQGEGFFQVRRPDGTIAYSRDGSLKLSGDGTLVTSQGYPLEPVISFPQNTSSIRISRDGLVEAVVTGDSVPLKVGQIELGKFVNSGGLKSIGDNLFTETAASGLPIFQTPGSEGFGHLLQGSLESSNVDVVAEMVNMIVAQRAYEINSKTIKTVEEMISMANNIKR